LPGGAAPKGESEYRYECPFKFTGTIDKLTFELAPA